MFCGPLNTDVGGEFRKCLLDTVSWFYCQILYLSWSCSILVEREMMKSPTIIWIVYFSFQFHQFLPHTLRLCCSLHTHFRLLCCSNGLIFIPYSITVCNFLKTILSDINIATPVFCWFMFTRYIFFYPFIFNLTILLYLKFNFL